MGKSLFIAEKPMVARAFAEVFDEKLTKHDGYMEGDHIVVTWCVGHLVTMSYPEVYDESLKRWRLDTLPFIPDTFKYEVIHGVKKQFDIVKCLLNREDVSRIYVCTDSGREGEYIYRLVRQEAGVHDKDERRVWIDSQTEDEIKRGIKEAKPLCEYDHLSDAAYLRAKEDYLMGINFSRLLTLKYGNDMAAFLNEKHCVVSVGRVMTCVLGMVVRREIEIRQFVKTPFYRVLCDSTMTEEGESLSLEWKSVKGSAYENSPLLYKENGFKEKISAMELIKLVSGNPQAVLDGEDKMPVELSLTVASAERKQEKKNPPLLYNLAEIQNDASKFFKISPDQTLNIIQSLYEKKLVTYPRTDARVLSSAIAKEITKNIRGLMNIPGLKPFAEDILEKERFKGIEKSRYTDDKKITDHYAIIPTGQGFGALNSLDATSMHVYEAICRRFLAIFYPPAIYQKLSIDAMAGQEHFFANDKYLKDAGYLAVMNYSFLKKKKEDETSDAMREALGNVKKGTVLSAKTLYIKEGETSPPKRYTSGSMILAMENAGSLIEDEELREQIKSNGIGTSATRAGILEKLVKIRYLSLNQKTQVITPTLTGEMVYYVVGYSVRSMLNAALTASWEKGLGQVAEGEIDEDDYMKKLTAFITSNTQKVKGVYNRQQLMQCFQYASQFYKKGSYGGIKKEKAKNSKKKANN
ncbi:MAG: type IA DNA topoisomerase [Lachnospiraceae bacterium]|nr:type IA DNA topoisomerase [Lachnospiraceae bacterium]